MSEIFSKILKDKNGKVLNVGSKYKQPEWGVDEVVLLPETELAFAMNDDLGMDCAFVELSQALAADASYTINFNGVVYNCKAVASENGEIVVGNATVLGGAGNNEPFMLLDMGGMNIVIPLDGSASATMSVAKEITHEIPSSYLETKEPLIVTVVKKNNNGKNVCSETAESIYEAVKAGRLVYLDPDTGMQVADALIPLMNTTDHSAQFGKFYINPNDVAFRTYEIDNDGVLTESYEEVALITSNS